MSYSATNAVATTVRLLLKIAHLPVYAAKPEAQGNTTVPEARTSKTHPMRIAEITCLGGGRIGMTFCPGKVQPDALSGAWDRNLDADLAVIRDWGARVIVTLVEHRELDALQVSNLGDRTVASGMQWLHLPIMDQGIPDAFWDRVWKEKAPDLHAILDKDGNVLVHCKGGLGRTGLVAARLLIERGTPPGQAIEQVRQARPGAIENSLQETYVRQVQVSGTANIAGQGNGGL